MRRIYLFILLILYSGGAFSQGTLTRISQLDMPVNGSFDIWAYLDTLTGIEYALLGSDGLVVVDVSDPANPTQVAHIPGIAHFDIKVWKQYAYTVNGGGGGSGYIVDLTDPLNPFVADSFPSAHNIWIDENGYMYAEYPDLKIYDLNPDPLNPSLIYSDGVNGGHDAFVKGNLLYDFHGYPGTNIYNISNPASPELLCNIFDPKIAYHHSGWVSEDDNYLFICDELADTGHADITVWDISDYNNPSKVGFYEDSFATVHNMYVVDEFAYVPYYSAGLRIFDISDPTKPAVKYEYDTNPKSGQGYMGAFGVYVYSPSKYLYVHDRDSGLLIFNIVQPTPMQNELSVYPNPSNGKFTMEFSYSGTSNLVIRIVNSIGEIVSEDFVLAHSRLLSKELELTHLAKGTYHLQVITNIEVFNTRIVLN